jgi:hypothetical protein
MSFDKMFSLFQQYETRSSRANESGRASGHLGYIDLLLYHALDTRNPKIPSLEPEGLYAAIFGFLGGATALHFALLSLAPEQLYVALFGSLAIAVALHFALLKLLYRRLIRVNDRLPETRR